MNPSAYKDGQRIGYLRGFKLGKNEWTLDYENTKWKVQEFERALNEENA